MPDPGDNERTLRALILAAPVAEGQDMDLRARATALGIKSERLYRLVHDWQDEGGLEYERNWYLVRLTKTGRLLKDEA